MPLHEGLLGLGRLGCRQRGRFSCEESRGLGGAGRDATRNEALVVATDTGCVLARTQHVTVNVEGVVHAVHVVVSLLSHSHGVQGWEAAAPTGAVPALRRRFIS